MTIQFRDRPLRCGEKSHYYCDECGCELHPDFAYSHKCKNIKLEFKYSDLQDKTK